MTIRRAKTDQEGRGAVIAIVPGEIACPVAALRAWLDAAEISDGPIFRPIRRGGHVQPARLTDRSVANIVKHMPSGPDWTLPYSQATHCVRAS